VLDSFNMHWLVGVIVAITLFLANMFGLGLAQHVVMPPAATATSSPVPSAEQNEATIPNPMPTSGDFGFSVSQNLVQCLGPDGTTTLPSSDPDSFQIVENLNTTGDSDGTSLIIEKDKNHVYLGCSVIPAADPATFTPINTSTGDFTGYLEDKNGVYFADNNGLYSPGTMTPTPFTTDTDHFQVLNGWEPADIAAFADSWSPGDPMPQDGFPNPQYAKDGSHIYVGSTTLAPADPATFTVVPGGNFGVSFGKDKNYVYIGDYLIPGVDPNSFVPVGPGQDIAGGYVKDVDNVYYLYLDDQGNWNSMIVAGADPATFVTVTSLLNPEQFDAQDTNHEYLNGVVVQ